MERTHGPEWLCSSSWEPNTEEFCDQKNKLKTLKFGGEGFFFFSTSTVITQMLTLVLQKYFEYMSIMPKIILLANMFLFYAYVTASQ